MGAPGVAELRSATHWVVVLAASMSSLAGPAFSADAPKGSLPTPAQLIASFAEQLAALKGVRFSYSTSTYQITDQGVEELTSTEEVAVNFDCEGERVRALRDPTLRGSADTGVNPVHVEQISLRDKYISFTEDRKKGTIQHISSKVEPSDGDWRQFVCLSSYSVLLGYVPLQEGKGYLPNVLREMAVAVRSDSVGAVSVMVLEGKSQDCELSLWLDPALNYQARRITFQLGPGAVKAGAVDSYVYEVQAFESVKGHHFPASFQIKTRKAGGTLKSPFPKSKLALPAEVKVAARSLVNKVRVKDFELNPRFSASDFALTRQVPNGTGVFMEDAPHIEHNWQDGGIVASVDPRMIEPTENLEFTMGPGSPRFWVILANVVVISAVVFLTIRRRLRRPTEAHGAGKAE